MKDFIKNSSFDICIHIGHGAEWLGKFYIEVKQHLSLAGVSVLFYTDSIKVKEYFDENNLNDYLYLEESDEVVDVDWVMKSVTDLGLTPKNLYITEQKFSFISEKSAIKLFSEMANRVFKLSKSKKAKYYLTYEGDEIDHNIFRILSRLHNGKNIYWGISNFKINTHFHYDEKRYFRLPDYNYDYQLSNEDISWIEEYITNYIDQKTNIWGDPSRVDVKFELDLIYKFFNRLLKFNFSDDPRASLYLSVKKYILRVVRRLVAKFYYGKLKDGEDFYYFPLHVPMDSQLTQRGLPFFDQVSLIETISNYMPYGAKLVVKEHPMGRGFYKISDIRRLANINNVLILPAYENSHNFISKAKAIFVINSSVGYEALMYNKVVVTFGRSFYRNNDLTIDINSLYELEGIFDRINKFNIDKDKFYKFIWRLKKYTYPVDVYRTNEINYLKVAEGFSSAIISEYRKREEIN